MLSKTVLWYGTEEPPPEQIALRAGPLSLIYENGDLRYIRLGGHEIVRRIYVAVRDQNWGTVLPVFSNVEMTVGADSFRITYTATHRQGAINFIWHATITGDPDGTIQFTMDGVARSTFLRNRIGFCVLHPSTYAGSVATVEHVDGTTESAPFPVYLVGAQPVEPFADMRAITYDVLPGMRAVLRMEGDSFEMEDQRNWTDASFKTFCTPLRLPYPVEVLAGTKIRQAVTLKLHGEAAVHSQQETGDQRELSDDLTFTFDWATSRKLPALGLGVASHDNPLSEHEIMRLRALALSHVRVDLLLADVTYPARLRQATQQAQALDVPLEVALLCSADASDELHRLRAELERIRPTICRWLVFDATTYVTPESLARSAQSALQSYQPDACFAAGTYTDFIFLHRNAPSVQAIDLMNVAIHPQAHAFDNASLVETLAAQTVLVVSARQQVDGKPVSVSPITLKPRFNPYATGAPPPLAPDALPPQVDVRQMSLLGAGWTLGSIKYVAESGVVSATYYETTGWRGVMETAAGSLLPHVFHSIPGGVFPLYHVLMDVGECKDGEVLASRSSDPLRVDGFAMRKDGRTRVLLANLRPETQRVHVHGIDGRVRVRILDETNAEEAMRAPEQFRAHVGTSQAIDAGPLILTLRPYAVARIDTESENTQ